MTLMRRSSPLGEMLSLRQAMDRLFEDSFVRPGRAYLTGEGGDYGIPLDVSSTADALVIEAALPGVKPDDVEITLLGDTLTINASTTDERESDDSGYAYREVRRGRFSRTVTFPTQVDSDKATADFRDGMLRLSIPKAEVAKPRRIRIGGATEQSKQVQPGKSTDPQGTGSSGTGNT